MKAVLLLLAAACTLAASAQAPAPSSIFLVAKGELSDPNFRQAVVLVAQGLAAGPIGVVINRPTDVGLADALPNVKGIEKVQDKLFSGGPVGRNVVVFLFRSAEPRKDSVAVMEDVHLSFDSDLLAELIARDKPMEGLRVFAGHAGWAPGQLEAEVARGLWSAAKPDARSIFESKPETLWLELTRRAASITARAAAHP
jgi:putative transcriptional regulator